MVWQVDWTVSATLGLTPEERLMWDQNSDCSTIETVPVTLRCSTIEMIQATLGSTVSSGSEVQTLPTKGSMLVIEMVQATSEHSASLLDVLQMPLKSESARIPGPARPADHRAHEQMLHGLPSLYPVALAPRR